MIGLITILAERPLWAIGVQTVLISICGTLIAGAALAWREKHRRKRCKACGHELTGKDSGTCPACGEKV